MLQDMNMSALFACSSSILQLRESRKHQRGNHQDTKLRTVPFVVLMRRESKVVQHLRFCRDCEV